MTLNKEKELIHLYMETAATLHKDEGQSAVTLQGGLILSKLNLEYFKMSEHIKNMVHYILSLKKYDRQAFVRCFFCKTINSNEEYISGSIVWIKDLTVQEYLELMVGLNERFYNLKTSSENVRRVGDANFYNDSRVELLDLLITTTK